MTAQSYAETLESLRETHRAKVKAEKRVTELTEKIKKLAAYAMTQPEAKNKVVAAAAGFSESYLSQIAPARQTRALVAAAKRAGVIGSATMPAESAVAPAPKKRAAPRGSVAARLAEAVGVATAPTPEPKTTVDADQPQLGARVLPGIAHDDVVRCEYGVSSKRKTTPQKGRVVAVADAAGNLYYKNTHSKLSIGAGKPGDWLRALPADVERVFFTGPRPWHDVNSGRTMTEDVREWLAAPLPEGWKAGSHHPDARNPCGRFMTTGRSVELRHAGEWTGGDCDVAPAVVWHAFRMLREGIRSRFENKKSATVSVELLGSPTSTGQDLWSRSIPYGTEYPVMSAELRELISTTSGQGRFELLNPGADELPELHYYDSVFAYSAITWGMPVGTPTRVTRQGYAQMDAEAKKKAVRGRSRWHATVTVPADWNHVGILPASGMDGWEYPSEPGRKFTTWAGGSEIWLALEHGWKVEMREGITWAEGKPLNLWRDKVTDLWEGFNALAATHTDPNWRQVARVAAKMARSILLHTIGGFASKGRQRSGLVAIGDEHLVPRGARAQQTDDGRSILWQMTERSGEADQYSHPEWAAEIWSRQRARLLIAPGDTGVLAGVAAGRPKLTKSQILAFRNDAVFATADTGWTNPENQPGRFRAKGRILSPVARPKSVTELLALRDRAEGEL
ncbi:hypothetical protein ACIA8O_39820 [Kitasatospora sp. NPDC051853]|uniref:hypothetical protein n=1 Tax=Kitasatospora sp. NPDC051853 TaxID=3364058 RepID=UPI0037888256